MICRLSSTVATDGCHALFILASSDIVGSHLGTIGACPILVEILKLHITDEKVLNRAVKAGMRLAAASTANARRLLHENFIEFLVQIENNHEFLLTNTELQGWARNARILCVRSANQVVDS